MAEGGLPSLHSLPVPRPDPPLPRSAEEAFRPPETRIIAAIDLGTKYSGYAFKLKDHQDVFVNTTWECSNLSYKTLTCLLMTRGGTVKSFGHQALQEYINMDDEDEEEEEAEEALFFDLFKMELYTEAQKYGAIDLSIKLKAAGGQRVQALKVFTATMSYLKDHMKGKLANSYDIQLEYEEVLWVLTVPAIWDDSAKNFMREAAIQAGLIRRNDPDRLIIALEPEAAALYCRELSVRDRTADSGNLRPHAPQEKYLVVDSGGGTVDTTVHEVLEDNYVREIHKALGGAHGGSDVDKNFCCLLAEIFGAEFMDWFKDESPKDYQQLMHNFEIAKRIPEVSPNAKVNIDLPRTFVESFKEMCNQSVEEVMKSFRKKRNVNVTFRRKQYFSIGTEDFKKLLFEPVLDAIQEVCQTLLRQRELRGLKTVFLVGGFADCILLQHRVREIFPDQVVVTPLDAGLSILKGAIRYGEKPAVITERVMARSYGIKVTVPFDEERHNPAKKFRSGDKDMCRDVFWKLVGAGDSMPIQKHKQFTVSPLNPKTPLFQAEVFISPDPNPVYIDDQSCRRLGKIQEFLPPPSSQAETRPINLYFYFGFTEIKVAVVECSTQQLLCKSTIEYAKN